eukprot:GHVS01083643.1.p1 GENE.GHVS01083643.1~~GHVS01083643.1.p1  ORF type:complete len:377 (-),score=57.96 GHVS01083643.1:752-1882(-)
MSSSCCSDIPVEVFDMSLESLVSNKSYKWIFVGGKGGVGKTTTSCAVAIELTKRRESVLVLSTDPAHNLSDAFGQKFSGSPSLVSGFNNLYAMEIDSSYQESSGYSLRDGEAWSALLPELLQALPGIDEAISFSELMHSVQSMEYSVIVFDTAPTGHTLRLLGFPEVLEQGLKKVIGWKSKLAGPMALLGMVGGSSLSEQDITGKLDHLKAITTSIRETFQDPCRTTFVCVCIAEFLSVYETERLVQELAKQNIDCCNIVVNQVLVPIEDGEEELKALGGPLPSLNLSAEPEHVMFMSKQIDALTKRVSALERAYKSRRRIQSKYLQQIEDLYCSEFHVVCLPQQNIEVRGTAEIRKFAELLMKTTTLPILRDNEL